MMADWMGACPGDQPKATRGMDISSAVLRTTLFSNPMHDVQMLLARSKVLAGKISVSAVKRNNDFMSGHGG